MPLEYPVSFFLYDLFVNLITRFKATIIKNADLITTKFM